VEKLDGSRYEVLIEKIKNEPSLKTKVDDLAVMVSMIAKFDLNSICAGFDGLHTKLDETIAGLKVENAAAILACSSTLNEKISKNKKHITKLFWGLLALLIALVITHPDAIGVLSKFVKLIF
jgi:hypothetical protein